MADAAALRARFDALARAYPSGQHGRWAANERADALDAWFVDAFDPPVAGVALVALGGYGRRLQLPASDVDILVIHAGLGEDVLAELGERLWYPLWDHAFTVTPLARTPAECVVAAADRLDSRTALLDARLVAGEPALLDAAIEPVIAAVRADPVGFAVALDADRALRRERAGSCAHDLAPDLKDGVGGLRDASSLGWLATAVGRPLVEAGLIRAADASVIEDAEEFYLRARSALHLETSKRTDRLTVDLQPEVAAGMGFVDEPGLAAIDALMRRVFEHGRAIGALVAAATARLRDDVISREDVPPIEGPAGVLEALAAVAERTATPNPALIDALVAASIPDPVVWDARSGEAFLRIVRTGAPGVEALDVLDRIGRLERFLPVWRDVRCRPQRDPYHRYTVDAHLTAALRGAAELLDDPGLEPWLAELIAEIEDRDAVLLGALLHDVGKIGHGDHVPIGAAIAREQLDAMSLPPATAELATFMVGEHLLLPDTATRRDLSDENLIMDVAATVGTLERLAALSVLAVADAAATGPAAWTPWRQTLVRELVTKVRNVLERGTMGEELAARLAERTEAVRALLAGEPEAEVDRFVLRMPRGYFLSMEPDQAERHFHAIAPHLGAQEVRTAAAPRGPGAYELLVVTPDRPALLALIAGALAVGGISILSAQVFTTDDRVAADVFEVVGAFEPEITEERWRGFRTTLRRGIEGAISIDRKVEDTRRHYPAPKLQTPVTVRVDNEASDFSTVIEVGAPDRMGLLHDITQAFSALDLDVHLAKVATFDGRVVDAFYVRDGLGRKVTDADRLTGIDRALRERLS